MIHHNCLVVLIPRMTVTTPCDFASTTHWHRCQASPVLSNGPPAAQTPALRDQGARRGVRTHPECGVPHTATRGLQGREQHVHLLLLCEGTAILAAATGTQGSQSV